MWTVLQSHGSWLLEVSRRDEPLPDPAIPCPSCRGDLRVVVAQDVFRLSCACGRELTVEDLRDGYAADMARGLQSLLLYWEDRLELLKGLALDARSHGFALIAEIIARHLAHLRPRLDALRRVL